MTRHRLNKKFLKYCPGCKVYQPSALTKCPLCKKYLEDLLPEYQIVHFFIDIGYCLIIILLCFLFTYVAQKDERAQYAKGFNLLINKDFSGGWKEIKGALNKNPVVRLADPLVTIVKIKSSKINDKNYNLQEIFYNTDNRDSAMINNKIVFEGESVDDYKVAQVHEDSIDIEKSGEIQNIKVGSSWN